VTKSEKEKILKIVKEVNGGNHYKYLRSLSKLSLPEIYKAIDRHPSTMGNFYEIVLKLHYFFRLHTHAGVLVNIDRGSRKEPTKLTSLRSIIGGGSGGGAVDITHVDFDGDGVIGITSKYKKKNTLSLADLEFLAVKATLDSTFEKISNKYYGIAIRDKSQIEHLYKTGELTEDVVVYDFTDMCKYWEDIQIFLKEHKGSLYAIENSINQHHKINITLRQEQWDGVQAAVNYFNKFGDDFLLNAKMRYGKIVTSYEIAKRMGAKTVLMCTFFPAVSRQWEEDAFDFANYNNLRVINTADLAGKPLDIRQKTKDEIVVVLTSYQDFKGVAFKRKWKKVKDFNWDLLISDEFHYGVESEQTTELLNTVKYKKHLALSGTPIKALMRGRFGPKNTYTWTYIDEQKKKKAGISEYKWLPTMNIHMMNIPEGVREDFAEYIDEESFTLTKLLSTENNRFLYEDTVIKFLDMLSGEKGFRKSLSPYHYGNTRSNGLRHTVWYMPNVDSTLAMEELLKRHPYFRKYNILSVNSKKYTAKDVLHIARHHTEKSDNDPSCFGSITLSFRQLNTGSSVPKWAGVFMMNETQSVETYMQTIFRSQSPNKKDRKEECHVFDFNPTRCLNILYEYAATVESKGPPQEVLSEWLEFAPLMSHDNNDIITFNSNEFMNQFSFEGSHSKIFGHQHSIRLENVTDELKELIVDVHRSTSTISMADVPDNNMRRGKHKRRKTPMTRKPRNKNKNDNKEVLKRLQTIAQSIPWLLLFTDNKYNNVMDALKHITEENRIAFEERCGVSIDVVKLLVDSAVLDLNYLNNQATSFNHAANENKLAVLENIVLDSTSDHNIKEYGELPTPKITVSEMLDSLPDEIWQNPNLKWLDPATCSGTFLLEIFDRLMNGLDCIVDDNDRAKHILHNMLYAVDIRASNVALTKIRLRYNDMEIKHIVCADSLSFDFWQGKFDVITCNPPTKELKFKVFADLSMNLLNHNGRLLFITQPESLVPGKALLVNDCLFKYALRRIEVNTIKYDFANNWKFVWFHLQKAHPKTKLLTDHVSYFNKILYKGQTHLNPELGFIPSLITKESLSILNKVHSFEGERLDIITTPDGTFNARNPLFHNEMIADYIHPYAHTSANNWETVCWSCEPHEYQYEKKVLISEIGYPRPIYDNGKLGMTNKTYGILVNSKVQGKNLINLLNSNLYVFIQLISNMEYGKLQNVDFYRFLPLLDLNHAWKNTELYKLFGISQKEVRLINKVIGGN